MRIAAVFPVRHGSLKNSGRYRRFLSIFHRVTVPVLYVAQRQQGIYPSVIGIEHPEFPHKVF